MNKGILYGVCAYLAWGFLPIYWKALHTVTALQILSHRIIWSFILLAILISLRKEWRAILTILARPRTRLVFILAAALLAVNWLTYIWGVNAGFIVETSLGYFINPLVNVLLGVIIFRERLRLLQWVPIGLAAVGVLYLTVVYGQLPWIALVLAFSFAFYGLVKKISPLGSLQGLTVETAILIIPGLIYLVSVEMGNSGAFAHAGLPIDLLLICTGFVTAIPLILFGYAAQTIPLSTLGLLQYLAPTFQFLIGVLLYGEPFTPSRLVGFVLIWLALILYTTESFITYRKSPITAASS
jgi:chloramphenicol-sensitive protein RarD